MNKEDKIIKELLKRYLKNKKTSKCPDEMRLSLFVEKKLSPEEEKEVINHLITCERCRDIVVKVSNLSQKERDNQTKIQFELKKKTLRKIFIPVSLAASILLVVFLYTEHINKDEEILLPKGKTTEEKKTFSEKIKEEIKKIIKTIKEVFGDED